ncbi:DUF4179 domain-containing protein [Paenibacillus bovis]|uniref:DUF4179 domain-containing protein n=1 Tax=Paenibacillus bovis TaxID=1616788 RepID=A0A172ZIG0_9BACL|nr:DUF4179 domain-containing protein [Paenibacillus bovis]ANF97323.1 hypothetical protein AR543_15820 [Paenibacillus bovis]
MTDHDKRILPVETDRLPITQPSVHSPVSTLPESQPAQQSDSADQPVQRTWWDARLLVVIIATTIVMLILLTTTWLRPVPDLQTNAASWGELEPFRIYQSEDVHNQSLVSAMEHNYIQMINKTAEQEGYKLTVNAVTADENRLILLYTAEMNDSRQIPRVSSVKLLNIATGEPISSSRVRMNGTTGNENRQQYYGTATMRLDHRQNFPREIAAQFRIMSITPDSTSEPGRIRYSPTLLVHFSLAPQFRTQETEIIYPNQVIHWNNHTVLLSRVELSPLEMRVRFTADKDTPAEHAKRDEIWLSPRGVISEKNGQSITLQPLGSRIVSHDPYTFEHVYYSNLLDEPDSLEVVVKPLGTSTYEDTQIIRIK